ncbi:MAG: hypothetical protein ACRYGI_10620 [Janthinobacterium lividum]
MLLPARNEQAIPLPPVAEVDIELAIKSIAAANDEQATIGLDRTNGSGNQGHAEFPIDTAHIRKVLRARSQRRKSDLGFLLEWPSWDMLLDLVATKLEGQHVSVSSLCLSSGAPQSTALRKLSLLEGNGLVVRYVDGNDRRRICLTLTDEAVAIVSSMVQEDIALLDPRTVTARPAVNSR